MKRLNFILALKSSSDFICSIATKITSVFRSIYEKILKNSFRGSTLFSMFKFYQTDNTFYCYLLTISQTVLHRKRKTIQDNKMGQLFYICLKSVTVKTAEDKNHLNQTVFKEFDLCRCHLNIEEMSEPFLSFLMVKLMTTTTTQFLECCHSGSV